ncbi:MAG: Do family serine endopeptidase [Saprospirales bacterium]|nr:Do family serine endopeptidase [Saprospirales bacterium]
MKQVGLVALSSVLSALLAVGIYHFLVPRQEVIIHETVMPAKNPYEGMLSASEKGPSPAPSFFGSSAPTSFTEAAEEVITAVVNIKAENRHWLRRYHGGISTGSGVIISPDGYVVTNNHVVEEADDFEITMNDKREFKAKLIGTDPSTDLALLKIEATELPHLQFGNSDSVRVGEWVMAVGNPFNLESTVTAGIVSAKGRNIDILEGDYSIESFIQTDAAVNPGNSGGALVNTRGDLIGINTAIITRSGRYEGYSFAVPSNLAYKVVRDLRDFGKVKRGVLGVGIEELTSELVKELGMSSADGIYINRVTSDGGAFKAGIRRGDVIIRVNGYKVGTMPELQELVARYRPGNKLIVEYFRAGKLQKAEVTLQDAFASSPSENTEEESFLQTLGFELRDLSEEELTRLGKPGVYVASIFRFSTIEETQMEPGYVITHINSKRVKTKSEAIQLMQKGGAEIVLDGYYEGYTDTYTYTFRP